jgi:hypothetical protein
MKASKPQIFLKNKAVRRSKNPAGPDRQIDYYLDIFLGDDVASVEVFGFLRRIVIDATGQPLTTVSKSEQLAAVGRAWRSKLHGKRLAKVAHRFTVEFAAEVMTKMVDRAVAIDLELQAIVSAALLSFQQKFHAGHELGFVSGVRRYRNDNLELVLLLYPQTNKGKPLNVTGQTELRFPDGNLKRINYRKFLENSLAEHTSKLYCEKVLAAPGSYLEPVDRNVQDMLLTDRAWKECEAEMKREKGDQELDMRLLGLQWVQWKRKLLRDDPHVVCSRLKKEYVDRIKSWEEMTAKNAETNLHNNLTWQGQLETRITKLAQKLAPGESPAELLPAYQTSIGAAFHDQRMLLGWRSLRWGGTFFKEPSERHWWSRRMQRGDEMGALMIKIHDDVGSARRPFVSASQVEPYRTESLRRRNIIQDHLCEMYKLQRQCLAAVNERLKKLKTEKEQSAELFDVNRLHLQRFALNIIDARAKIAGQPPEYHNRFRNWTRGGAGSLPVRLRPTERPRPDYASNEALNARQYARTASSPANLSDFESIEEPAAEMKAEPGSTPASNASLSPPLSADETTELEPVMEIAMTGPPSHISATSAISATEGCAAIFRIDLDKAAIRDALENNREALQRVLAIPRNDAIEHSPVVSTLDPNIDSSFDSIEL